MEKRIYKVYVAGPWKRKEEAAAARLAFEEAGFAVTSRWIDVSGDFEKDGYPTEEAYFKAQAEYDVKDVIAADILVMLNLEPSEGKMFELGLAMGLYKPSIIVGERTHTFHYLPVPRVSTVGAAIELSKQWIEDYEKSITEEAQEEETIGE